MGVGGREDIGVLSPRVVAGGSEMTGPTHVNVALVTECPPRTSLGMPGNLRQG